MSRICLLTGKHANFGQSRSHSNIASKRRQNVNLQTVRINGQRLRVSTRALKTIKKYLREADEKLKRQEQHLAAKTATKKKQTVAV